MTESTETPPAESGAELADLAGADPARLASVAAAASDEQLTQAMSDPATRQTILDEVFRRMSDHLDPEKAKGIDAVLLWRVTDAPGGGEDTYEVTIKDGAASVTADPTAAPRVTFIAGPAAFLRLVSGAQAGPVLFMAGKLRIEGDLMFASQVATLFRIPQAAS